MSPYSALALLKHAVTGRPWPRAWRDPAPKARVRRHHRRGRRPRSCHRLLPGQGIRHPQRRRAGEGLYRLRQCRAQHHHRPLQLHARPAPRSSSILAEALERPVARAQLQRACSRRAARSCCCIRPTRSTVQRGAATSCGGTASPRELLDRAAMQAAGAASRLPAERAFPDLGRADAADRRHRAPRCGGLGLCARGVRSGRRHHPELRGHRLRPRRRADRRRGDRSRRASRRQGRDRGRRPHLAARRDGGAAAADREPPAAGLRVGAVEAAARLRDRVRRPWPFLYQPVGQGRHGLRRRSRHATTPMRSAAICRWCATSPQWRCR